MPADKRPQNFSSLRRHALLVQHMAPAAAMLHVRPGLTGDWRTAVDERAAQPACRLREASLPAKPAAPSMSRPVLPSRCRGYIQSPHPTLSICLSSFLFIKRTCEGGRG